MITHFSFVLCTAGPFSSAWVQTEAFPWYLKEDYKTGNYGMFVDSEVQTKKKK